MVGSQVIGLIPLKAVTDSADHYMEKEGVFVLEEDQKIRLVGGPFYQMYYCHLGIYL